MKYGFIMLMLILVMTNANAHEKHKHKENVPDTVQTAPGHQSGSQMEQMESHEHTVSNLVVDGKLKINYGEHVFAHLHNKLVHFPVALASIAFLFTLLSFKWKEFSFSIKWIVLIAAVFAVAAFFTGLNQAEVFEGEPGEWVVDIHRLLGIFTMSFLLLWTCFLFVQPLKRFAWIISIISFVLIIITAFYGGIVAHGI